MQLEIHELELKYGELRITDRRRMSTLAASLLENGHAHRTDDPAPLGRRLLPSAM